MLHNIFWLVASAFSKKVVPSIWRVNEPWTPWILKKWMGSFSLWPSKLEALRFFQMLWISNPMTKRHIAEGLNFLHVNFCVISSFVHSLIHSFFSKHFSRPLQGWSLSELHMKKYSFYYINTVYVHCKHLQLPEFRLWESNHCLLWQSYEITCVKKCRLSNLTSGSTYSCHKLSGA
jgi:hypothetical protein